MFVYKAIHVLKPKEMSQATFDSKLEAFDSILMGYAKDVAGNLGLGFSHEGEYETEVEDDDSKVEHGTASWGDAGYFCHCGAKFESKPGLDSHIKIELQQKELT